MAATRFPGKPLASLLGLSMIEHVRRRAALCRSIDDTVVATCDRAIFDEVIRHGGKAVMTSDRHERCTDRVAEAAAQLDAGLVVNVQGDEPLVRPDMLEVLIRAFDSDRSLPCANLMVEIHSEADFQSPNVIKTVVDRQHNALYFSRQPVPFARKGAAMGARFKQLGIIAFKSEFLSKFAALEPTPLEIAESIDMLRALEHGHKVKMVLCPFESIGVDTPADLERASALLQRDPLTQAYL